MMKKLWVLDSYLFCVKMNFYFESMGHIGTMQKRMLLIMILFVEDMTDRKIEVNIY